MALSHHDAAHRDEAERANAKFFSAKDRRDHNIAPGFQATIGAQFDAVTQAVERQHLVDLGKPHFPRRSGIFD